MTSEGRARPREGEEAPGMPAATGADDGSPRATDTGSPEEEAGTSGGGDSPRTRSRPSLPLVPTLLGGGVLQSAIVDIPIPLVGELHLVTSVFFDIGVYLVVVGLALDVLRSLGSGIDAHIENEEDPDPRREVPA